MANPRKLPRSATLRIIRVALLSGVLMFGGVAYVLTRESGGLGPESAEALQLVNIVILVAAGVGIIVMQRRHAVETDPDRRTTLNILAWAMGEAAAMMGGVHYLLVGNPVPFLVGLVMMIASFVVVPIRD